MKKDRGQYSVLSSCSILTSSSSAVNDSFYNGMMTYNSKPSEQHINRLIDKLKDKSRLAQGTMMTPPDLIEMREAVHSGEETAIQPTTALQDEIGHFRRDIRLARRGLDILQDPGTIPFSDELETQDSIFGEVHIGGEDTGVGTVHLLTGEVFLQGTLAGLVVLEGDVTVSGKGTGQDGDEAESAFERLVEDVAHFVFEVLCGDQRVDEGFAVVEQGFDFATGA